MARLKLRPEASLKLRTLAGPLTTDTSLAELLQLDRTTLHRHLTEKTLPSNQFIAGVVNAFGAQWFDEIFYAVPGNA